MPQKIAVFSFFGYDYPLFERWARVMPPDIRVTHYHVNEYEKQLRDDILVKDLHVHEWVGGRKTADYELSLEKPRWQRVSELSPALLDRMTVFERSRGAYLQDAKLGYPLTMPLVAWEQYIRTLTGRWYHLMRRLLQGSDLLVVWNGSSYPTSAAAHAAASLGIRTVFCEHGVLPRTIAMDTRGINYENSIVRKPVAFFAQRPVSPAEAGALYQTQLQQRPLNRAAQDPAANCDDGAPLPERYLLFAMQVHDDTQILLFSPRFHTMQEAIRYTWESIERYNRRTGDTLRLVIKEHPSDFGRIDYDDLRATLPGLLLLRATPLAELIPDARAVVTINSTAGIESLIKKRPVITLGDAFYNIPGVVRHLGADEELDDALGEVIDRPIDEELVTKFLCFLKYEYLVPGSFFQPDADAVRATQQRLLDIFARKFPWMEERAVETFSGR